MYGGKGGTSNLFCDTALMRIDHWGTFHSSSAEADVIKPKNLRTINTLNAHPAPASSAAIRPCLNYINANFEQYVDEYMVPMYYASPFLFLFAFEYINPSSGNTPDIWQDAKDAGVNLTNNNQKLTTWFGWLKLAKYASDQTGEYTIIDWLERGTTPSVTAADSWLTSMTPAQQSEVLYFLNEQAKLLIETAYGSANAFFHEIKTFHM